MAAKRLKLIGESRKRKRAADGAMSSQVKRMRKAERDLELHSQNMIDSDEEDRNS